MNLRCLSLKYVCVCITGDVGRFVRVHVSVLLYIIICITYVHERCVSVL